MHHIRRQTFEISFPSQEKAFELQTRFTDLMHQTLLPVMEEVFAQVSLPNVIVRLEKLEIDLGEIDFDTIEQELPEKLRNKLMDALQASIGEIRYFPTDNNLLVAKEKADIEILIHFLQNGTLPWWSSHPRQEDFSLVNVLEQCLLTQPNLLITHLQQVIKAPEVRIRLIRQFSDETLFKLFTVLIPARIQFVKSFVSGLLQSQQARQLVVSTPAAFREMVWEFITEFVLLQQRTSFEEKVFAEELFTHLTKQVNVLMPQVLMAVSVPESIHTSLSSEQAVVQRLARQLMAEQQIRNRKEYADLWQQNKLPEQIRMLSPAERFSALIEAAAPTQVSQIEDLYRQMNQMFGQVARHTSVSSQQVSQVIREAFIHYLWVEQRTTFDSGQLLRSTLISILQTLTLPVKTIIHHLPESSKAMPAIQQALQKILDENPQLLTAAEQQSITQQTDSSRSFTRLLLEGHIKPPAWYSDLDILTFFLRYGVIPWTERIRTSPNLIEQLIQTMRETQPEQFRQWITASGLTHQPAVVQRIRTQFSPETAAWLLGEIPDIAPDQTMPLTIEELSAKADVLIHYVTRYLESGDLPEEVPVPLSELLPLLITIYPEACQEFISTLPESQQQHLLDSSPELVSFLADAFVKDTASTLPLKELARPESEADHTGTLPEQATANEENLPVQAKFLSEDRTFSTDEISENRNEVYTSEEKAELAKDPSFRFDINTPLSMAEKNTEESPENQAPKKLSTTSNEDTNAADGLSNSISDQPVSPVTGKDVPMLSIDSTANTENTREEETTINISSEDSPAPLVTKENTDSFPRKDLDEKNETANRNEQMLSSKENLSPEQQAILDASPEHSAASVQDTDDSLINNQKSLEEAILLKRQPAVDNSDKAATEKNKVNPVKPLKQKLPGNSSRYIWRQPEEPLYIRNAGLVLIHPFLSRLFTLLKLTANRKFIDEQAAQRGVHLLHYISHKSEQAPEYELALNKVLCGLPVSMPLEKEVELTNEEKETCESLITGVIQNWPILKNTSPENFRVSFLHREGRLLYTSEDWQLKVENRGYDILIDKLPWAYSMIKLPWMEKVLRVEWR